MNNDTPLSEQIKALSEIEKSGKLNFMNVLTFNDGHLKTSLYGITKNFDLLTHTLVSWIIAIVFFAFGALSYSIFGTIGVVVYIALVELLFIWLGLNSVKEYKNVMNSILNIKHAIDSDLIIYEHNEFGDKSQSLNVSFMTSNDQEVAKSLGLIAKFVAIFNSKQLLGAVILKHKNHMPFIIIMGVMCLMLIAMTQALTVSITSLALLITLVSCFVAQGKMYKSIVIYFAGIKENLITSLKERADELNEERKLDERSN